jgi:hypothetical protein
MPVEIGFLKFDGLDLHGLDLLEVFLVVQAVAEDVTKSA